MEVGKSGYLYVYVSNATPNVDVFFDNLQVTHTRGQLLETNEYYPFGLLMKNISYRAVGFLVNKYKFNAGTELNEELELQYYETPLRIYDPQTGRFTGIDILAEHTYGINPYQFGFNNPVMFNDPTGMMATTNSNGDIHLSGFDAMQAFGMLQSNAAFDGLSGVESFFKHFNTSWLENGGSGGDFGVRDAVWVLHVQWGVDQKSYGGSNGMNNIVNRMLAQGAEKMDFEGIPFYDLTAGETVREQVFNGNFGASLGTILSAYNDVFSLGNYNKEVQWNSDFAHNTYVFNSDKRIVFNLSKRYFEDFAYATKGRNTDFGLLVRTVYHEYIHAWDMAGIHGHNRINSFDKVLLEFRAHFLMADKSVRLPFMSDLNKSIYWKATLNYEDSYGRKYGDLYNLLSPNNKIDYKSWHDQILAFPKP